jgi:hypothetical protein
MAAIYNQLFNVLNTLIGEFSKSLDPIVGLLQQFAFLGKYQLLLLLSLSLLSSLLL